MYCSKYFHYTAMGTDSTVQISPTLKHTHTERDKDREKTFLMLKIFG